MRALAVKPEYAHKIIEGKKTIEIRSKRTKIQERVAIYSSAPEKKIIGTVEIVATSQCNGDIEYALYRNEHLAPDEYYREGKTHFWHLRRPVEFETPIPIKWPSTGSWAKIELPGVE